MTENRITETGVYGPVFAWGVKHDAGVAITEGIVEFHLLRHDTCLTVEMTVEAADTLAYMLVDAVTDHLKGTT